MIQKQLFISFLRSGMLGFGGGPASIPLIKREVVDRYSMMTEDEFYEIMAIGNTLPGPIVTKLAGYIGYRVGGLLGMLNAIFSSILPSIILLVVLVKVLFGLKHIEIVEGMMNGILPIIAVMMFVVFLDCFKKTKKSFGLWKGILIMVIVLMAMTLLGIHPAIVVAIMLILALSLPTKKGGKA